MKGKITNVNGHWIWSQFRFEQYHNQVQRLAQCVRSGQHQLGAPQQQSNMNTQFWWTMKQGNTGSIKINKRLSLPPKLRKSLQRQPIPIPILIPILIPISIQTKHITSSQHDISHWWWWWHEWNDVAWCCEMLHLLLLLNIIIIILMLASRAIASSSRMAFRVSSFYEIVEGSTHTSAEQKKNKAFISLETKFSTFLREKYFPGAYEVD